jgi:hypothetical protein
MPNNTMSKANKVADLMTKKYYKTVIHPLLIKYKVTVLSVLLEEETPESLEELEKFLVSTVECPDLTESVVVH